MATATATHTPGPWTVHAYRSKGELEPNKDRPGFRFDDITIGIGDLIVGNVQMHTLPKEYSGYPTVSSDEERDANARLICAAPDLLNALNGLIGLVQLVTHRVDLPRDVCLALTDSHRYRDALAVVARVGGGE